MTRTEARNIGQAMGNEYAKTVTIDAGIGILNASYAVESILEPGPAYAFRSAFTAMVLQGRRVESV